ncbi:MAG: hypothetical protein Q8P22_10690, partial [Chloroflexota bacterium]|nr:hypothetical protein [Chloroflexota bacterium]
MSESTLRTEASQVIERYVSDETMLDALLQWASNPTSMSAGYGLEENYPYIAKNLAARYSISRPEAEKRVAELRSVCNGLIEQVEKLLHIEPRWRTGETQGTLLAALEEEAPKRVLRQGVLKRLREVSDETRRALLVFMLLEKAGSTLITPNSLRRPADRYSDDQSGFQAYYKSVFDDTMPAVRVVDELVRCGAYSELYWVPSPTAKSSSQPTLVKAVIPTVEEIEMAGTHLPSPPDIPALLESHWRHGDFDLLRTIDVVSHSYGGVWRADEPLPVKASSPGFIGVHGQRVALSPVIAAATRQQMEV